MTLRDLTEAVLAGVATAAVVLLLLIIFQPGAHRHHWSEQDMEREQEYWDGVLERQWNELLQQLTPSPPTTVPEVQRT